MAKMLVKPTNSARKIAQVTDNLGFQNVSKQQGTTVSIYDSVELINSNGPQVLTFFKECNTRTFPLTNLTRNQFNNGEAMQVERFFLYVIRVDTTVTPNDIRVLNIETDSDFARMNRSDLDFTIASGKVLKSYNVMGNFAPFNRDAQFLTKNADGSEMMGHNVKNLDLMPVIPPITDFYAELKIPGINKVVAPGVKWYLTLNLEGAGSLYAPKANM